MADSAQVGLEPIEIVLADDHAMVRAGLRLLLDSEPDFKVVGEAGDIEAALRATREHRPTVVVLDLNMPGAPHRAGNSELSRGVARCGGCGSDDG